MNKRRESSKLLLFILVLFIVIFPIASETKVLASSNIKASSNSKREIPIMTMDDEGKLSVDNEWMEAGGDKKESSINIILTEYRTIIVGLLGLSTLTSIVAFIRNLSKLAISAGNPSERSNALKGLLWAGIATTGLGSVSLFVGFVYNAL